MAVEKLILAQASDPDGGLYAIDLDTGITVWWFDPDGRYRGHTPAVDQDNGYIYYQCNGRMFKINAITGEQLDYVAVNNPGGSFMGSGNTLLVDDANGYYIAGVFNDSGAYECSVRVYDANLDLVWEDKDLMLSIKTVMAYYDGKLFVPKGQAFSYSYIGDWYNGDPENAGVICYDITDGTILWEYTCDSEQVFVNGSQRGVVDCIYCNGKIVFKTCFEDTTEIYVLDASDGSLDKKFTDNSGASGACAPSVLSGGKLFDGSLADDAIKVYTIGTGTFEDWNTYGNTPQLNHNVAHADCLQSIAESLTVNTVSGGQQGGVIIDSVAYFLENENVVKFNPATLAITDNYTIGSIYDSTPLMVENQAGIDVLCIKESINKRVIALDSADGDRLWNSVETIEGNLFFGLNYYKMPYLGVVGGAVNNYTGSPAGKTWKRIEPVSVSVPSGYYVLPAKLLNDADFESEFTLSGLTIYQDDEVTF